MRKRFGAALCAPMLLTSILAVGSVRAQEEVHVDGSVVIYDGATQRMSPGAHPTALILNAPRRSGNGGSVQASHPPPPEIAAAIHGSAQRHNVDERLVQEVAWQESRYRNAAPSPKGARGIMELMPAAARQYGVNASDPEQNIDGGVRVLSDLLRRYDGDRVKALAAYNAGPGKVDLYGGVPPYRETQNYVHSIMGRMPLKLETPSGSQTSDSQDESPLKARMSATSN